MRNLFHRPSPSDLVYLGAVGAMVALELVEWPAAIALAIGHEVLRGRTDHGQDTHQSDEG